MINFYEFTKKDKKVKNPNYALHGIDIPFRMVIAAPSGSGKTNFLCNILAAFDNTFHKIIICVKNKAEPLYEMIEERLNQNGKKQVEVYEDGVVPPVPQIGGEQSIIIFDDLLYDKQSEIKQYFIRGRKKGFSCVYLTQSYFQTPKDLRLQCNYIVLGRNVLKRDLSIILTEIASNLSLPELKEIYNEATKEPLHVVMFDLVKRNIRCNLNKIIANL